MSANIEYLLREILTELRSISNKMSKEASAKIPNEMDIADEISKVRSKVNKEIYGSEKRAGADGSFSKEGKQDFSRREDRGPTK